VTDPEAPFDVLATPVAEGPGRYRWLVPDGWQQGRGAFGGLVVGAMCRAGQHHAADPDRALRSIEATLVGPLLPGIAVLEVHTLRAGAGVSSIAVSVAQEEVVAHGVFTFGRRREVGLPDPAPVPPVVPNERVDGGRLPAPPPFLRFFDIELLPPAPFSGGEALTMGRVRMRNPGATRDAAWLVAHADAWFPALFTAMHTPRPMATLSFSLHMGCDPAALPADTRFLHVGTGHALHEGYACDRRELWTDDGRLVALNQQTFVVIK
jgi:hypothetical protein